MNDLPSPPVAATHPHSTTRHGQTIDDPWHWLRDPSYPEVNDPSILSYLREENAYFEAAMAPQQGLIDTIFGEMKGRIAEDDSSVPQKNGEYLYWVKFTPGQQYPVRWRRPVGGGADEVLFDEPAEAAGHAYFRMGALVVSPDARLAAWSCDATGAERFTLKVRDIAAGNDLETISTVCAGGVVWSTDGQALAYVEVNEQWRPWRIRLHQLGTDPEMDAVLYEEQDSAFRVGIGRSNDRKWLIVEAGNHQTTECWFAPLDQLDAPLTCVSPRREKRIYSVDSGSGRFWVLTNDDHVNFRLAEASWDQPSGWHTVIAGSDRTYLTGLSSFARHLVITQRVDGLDQIILRDYDGRARTVPFPEASYTVNLAGNPEHDPAEYRLGYSSMVTPSTVFSLNPDTLALTTLKTQHVPSGYNAGDYATERLVITARDGAGVPVSVVYRKGFPKDGTGKLLLYGYGAYGMSMKPYFSSGRLSLLDRGWAYAIAHIRGGDDLGYKWYLDGKAEKRWNTFNDFVDVAEGLIDARLTSPGLIAINGGSAGGELVAVAANTHPELWGAVVAEVPFVDVLNTMQDASLPLTPAEWPEWGNPIDDEAAFKLIQSYSPYENVQRTNYPPMLVTAGLSDPRVTYWEPAKWVARLRATKTDDNVLLLKMNMGAGHGGKSGRYEALREVAETYSFLLTTLP